MREELKKHSGIMFGVIIIVLLVFTLSLILILFNQIAEMNKVLQILAELENLEG